MKIVLSNKIYFKSTDEELLAYLQKHLTYEIIEQSSGGMAPRYHSMFGCVGNDVYWIPNTRLDLVDTFYQGSVEFKVSDKREKVPAIIPKPAFTPRSDQAEIIDGYESDSIINGAPGFGKTITALAIAHKLQQKTLVVCTNVDIRRMWEAEIEKWFGFSPSVIGSGKKNWDMPITVANIQTVRKLGLELAGEFGLLIIDEAHHCTASTFDFLVMNSRAHYKIGLTGTLWRKDGLHVCFTNYFGRKIFKPKESNTLPPTIHRYKMPMEVPGESSTPWALRINELYANPNYRGRIKDLANSYALLGHKVLVVADRTEMLGWLNEDNLVPSFIITGEVEDRIAVQEAVSDCPTGCILYATQSIFAEGISLNALSCALLGAPTNNQSLVNQVIGRIQRIEEGKLAPVAIDLHLKGNTGSRHASVRKGIYATRGWPLEEHTVEDLAKKVKKVFDI